MSRRRTKRPYDSHATRERILDAAMTLFQRDGYHATSMYELLVAARVPGGSMYHCFPTKKSLALAVIRERVMRAVHETWVEPVRRARDARAGIIGVFRSVATELDARHRVIGCPVTNLAVELAGVDAEFRAVLHDAYAAWGAAVRDRLAEQRSAKRADDLATLIVAAFAGAMSLAKTANSSAPLVQCATCVRAILDAR
ncbi:MAG TPA: TetR/AcrR family transcriptional regulator [Kofleriaceae bacterium]|jgi:AcrR family transcriptional regulator